MERFFRTRLDPVKVLQPLIQDPSVTPCAQGSLGWVKTFLQDRGFLCTDLPFGPEGQQVPNLYAQWGTGAPHLCFAGHLDVVPVGEESLWTQDPFGGAVVDGQIYGRGATDMKGAVACFLVALDSFLVSLEEKGSSFTGTVSLLLTGDEEGPARYGTKPVLEWMQKEGHIPTDCLLGEPTNPSVMGEALKVGRRGSLSAKILLTGLQGHVAYPERVENPIHALSSGIQAFLKDPLDAGTEYFPPSSVQVTTVDVGNTAENIVPQQAHAHLNIRFNDSHSFDSLEAKIRKAFTEQQQGCCATFEFSRNAEAFVTKPNAFTSLLEEVVEQETGRRPECSTSGGTSDARFIQAYCPVVEFGAVGKTMHQIDESAAVSDLDCLSNIYMQLLKAYF